MMQFEEFQYLVEYAIDFFKRGSERNNQYIYYEDVAWDYARGILENILDESKKQNLYSGLIKKLNKMYKKHQVCFPDIVYDSIGNGNIPDEKSEAILLFLMDWNYPRFRGQIKKGGLERLRNYINETLQRIHAILQSINDIRNKSSKEAFEKVEKMIKLEENEYVSAAKILMLINPDRFIALDQRIIKRFGFPSDDSKNYHENYGMFNGLVNDFINRNCVDIRNIENYAKYHMRINSYIDNDSHNIRKLLDMIFWITCNKKRIDDSNFYIYAERFIDDILHLFWIEESEQFQNNNSQEKTFWEIFCERINLDPNEAVKWLEGGFSPGEAKEWIDKNFSLEQAKEWRNNGVRSPEGAQYWGSQPNNARKRISQIMNKVFCAEQASLFDSGEIDIWIKAGFSRGEAEQWIAAGFRSPKEAAAWIAVGFLSPKEAKMWKDAGFSPGEAAAWKTFGFSLNQATRFSNENKYGSPLKALKALKRDTPKKDTSEAWEILNNPNNPPNNPPNFPSPNR